MRRSRIALTCAVAVGCLALAASAQAYMADVSSRSEGTPFGGGTFFAEHQTDCTPELQQAFQLGIPFAINGGARIRPALTDYGLVVLFPGGTSNPQYYDGGAVAVDPSSDPFSLDVFAYCAILDAPPPGQNNAGYVKSVEIIHAQSGFDSSSSRSVSVGCPIGKQLIGGGGDVDAIDNLHGPRDVVLDRSGPSDNDQRWVVRAHESDSTPDSWQVEVKAICANLNNAPAASSAPTASSAASGHYVDGVHYVFSNTPLDSTTPKTAVARCPAGENIVGGGSQVRGIEGPPDDVALSRSQPHNDNATATAWEGEARETDTVDESWSVSTVAVCANINAPATPPG